MYAPDPKRAGGAATRGGTRGPGDGAGGEPAKLPTDDYLAKLVKYIPAEVIAFFTPIAAFLGDNDGPILVLALAGAAGTLIWIYANSLKVPREQAARWFTYLLGVLAFAAWALGISSGLRAAVGISDDWAGVILAIAVFILPGLDLAFSGRRPAAG